MPGPNLESIESNSADENSFGGIYNVIYKATSQAFQEYQEALATYEKRRKSSSSIRRKLILHLFILIRATIDSSSSQNSKSQATFALYSSCSGLLPHI